MTPTATYSYPSAATLREIEQDKLPNLLLADPIFDVFPVTTADDDLLIWEQSDNYVGLQQIRGLNGQPARVQLVGAKQYMARPGVYGEFIAIDEMSLTRRRQYGTFATPIDISDLVMQAQDQLLGRRIDRIKYIGWNLLTTGTFSVASPVGGVAHTDSFALQTYDAATSWATAGSSTPLADLRAMQLLSRGRSVDFGPRATLWVNRVTANHLLSNTNAADIGGKRTSGLANIMSMGEVNTLLTGEGLPNIAIYDEGYLDDGGTFQPWLADLTGVLVGARSNGAAIGEYRMTRNASNADLSPGPFTAVIDSAVVNGGRPPRTIEVHDGHNGGPVLFHPSAIIRCTLS
jgi:hypothetical protein